MKGQKVFSINDVMHGVCEAMRASGIQVEGVAAIFIIDPPDGGLQFTCIGVAERNSSFGRLTTKFVQLLDEKSDDDQWVGKALIEIKSEMELEDLAARNGDATPN